MENYQVFFPNSSVASSSSSSSTITSSSSVAPSPSLFPSNMVNFNLLSNLRGENQTGYPSFMKADSIIDNVPRNSGVNSNINSHRSITTTVSNGTDGPESEVKSGKKKGEKKVRNPRYAFQTRSQVDILDDGYRWRKYGQKAVKNNKHPRSYYRCTHQGCNVKKQVQRLSKDEGVVVTTYEGMHTHPIEKSTDNFEHILSQMQIYSTGF